MPRPDKRAAEHRARSDERKKDVAKDMVRLKGRSEDKVVSDDRRGAGSPLGHGKIAEKRKRK